MTNCAPDAQIARTDYAPPMVALRRDLEILDRMLRDKAPAHECRPLIREMLTSLFRVDDYLKEVK